MMVCSIFCVVCAIDANFDNHVSMFVSELGCGGKLGVGMF